MAGVGSRLKGFKTTSTGASHPSFVLGSRPPGLRAPRIKPLSGVTEYGKTQRQPGPQANGFGNTMTTGLDQGE